MGLVEELRNYIFGITEINFGNSSQFAPKRKVKEQVEVAMPMPVSSARSSVETAVGSMAPTKLNEVAPEFPLEYLATIEHLAVWNEHVSHGIDNIISLANTKHDIYFSDKVSESQAAEMKAYLLQNENKWYGLSTGMRSLKGDVLAQIVINGAASTEIVPNEQLNGLKKVVRVAPKRIRFSYNVELDEFEPWQILNFVKRGTDYLGSVKLNTITYKYVAHRRYLEGPYAIPPFLTAIRGLIIEAPMIESFAQIMKKMGMLGFVSVTVDPPEKQTGETPQQYWDRCQLYLDQYVYPQIKQNMGSGVVAGFTDSFEFNIEGNNMNASGAEKLMQIIDQIVFSGLKQDPNMLGRNYSTTETFGTVIMRKMTSQIAEYQAIADEIMANVYWMALLLAGYDPGYVRVESRKPLISDQVKEAEAEKIRIDNVIKKRDNGIIGQKQAANELEYDKPFDENYVAPQNRPQETGVPAKKTGAKNAAESVSDRMLYYQQKFNVDVPEFVYLDHHNHNHQHAETFGDSKTDKLANTYVNKIESIFNSAVAEIAEMAGAKLQGMNPGASVSQVQEEIYMVILTKWENEFVIPMQDESAKQVRKLYDLFRRDKSIFRKSVNKAKQGQVRTSITFAATDVDIPEPSFKLSDYRTIEYMEQHDSMYLGKFITDDDTKKRIYKYIKDKYIGEGLPIGKSDAAIAEFVKEFKKELKLESWKIRRVIDTSVIKMKSFGNLRYMDQAEIEKYEVVEISDNLTCGYCNSMDGRVFSVKNAVSKIDAEMAAGPENINQVAPFATTIKLSDFEKMSDEELESAGILKQPFHPHCRGRLLIA